MSTKERARPMSREDRRQAIVDAVTPLLIEHGGSVTSAQLAEAAGVAEGTIFRAFTDKAQLLREALKSCFDPAETVEKLERIDLTQDIESQARQAAAALQERYDRIHALMPVMKSMSPADSRSRAAARRDAAKATKEILAGLSRLFEANRSQLAMTPERAAVSFNGLMLAVHFPFVSEAHRLTTDEAVHVLLNGVTRKPKPQREH